MTDGSTPTGHAGPPARQIGPYPVASSFTGNICLVAGFESTDKQQYKPTTYCSRSRTEKAHTGRDNKATHTLRKTKHSAPIAWK